MEYPDYSAPSPVKRDQRGTAVKNDLTGDIDIRSRVQLLQALFPYADYSQIISIVTNTDSAEEATRVAYDVINPNYLGTTYLKEQMDLSSDAKRPKRDREQAFTGVNEMLRERAEELFKEGSLVNLSQMQEYDRTVQTFGIDTTKWDDRYLPLSTSLDHQMCCELSLCDKHSDRSKSDVPSFELDDGEKSSLVEDSNDMLPAPIMRWAPMALSVEFNEAVQQQENNIRVFEDDWQFPNPFVSSGDSAVKQDDNGDGEHVSESPDSHDSSETHEPFMSSHTDDSMVQEKDTVKSSRNRLPPRRQGKEVPKERMKNRKPLGNLIFQRTDAELGQGTQVFYGDSSGGNLNVDSSREEHYTYDDPIVFLSTEEDHLNQVLSLLEPYSNIFDYKCQCEVVVQIYESCPRFVEKCNDVFVALLGVLEKELSGRTLTREVTELPVSLPFLGSNLFSTGPIAIQRLTMDRKKSSLAFTEDGIRVRVKLHVNELVFDPIDFAFIKEVEALIQNEKYEKENLAYLQHRRTTLFDLKTNYTKGVTRGVAKLKASRIRVEVLGGMWLFSSGKTYLVVEKCKVSIGSLSVSTDVTKLKVLLTLGHVIVKSVIEKEIRSFLTGTHQL
uniref:Uncharacterized protein n=1 Tax=Angomonas deanei TaxID=59799 RepID=A0A7G2C9T4_9TRYP|nr:hypothetical protein AGDE_13173 [Angomonas deanei]CAD2215523.1 hypothetical protein, conserved [Angomonas deanei]|eukprot:EPY22670.1 hypothetical protein AGDE_13173 [Angomonas deanei]